MKAQALLLSLAALAGSFLFSSCSIIPEPKDDPTRYYSLSLPARTENKAPNELNGLRIGLRPIEMPSYLKKGLLVVREGESEVRYNDYSRWAEPLDAGIFRLLRDNLESNAKLSRVIPYPFPFDEERDYDVRIRIRCAEGQKTGSQYEVHFEALIELSSAGAGSEITHQKLFRASGITWDGKNYANLAKGLSEAVKSLSDEIAALIPEQKGIAQPH
jgi:uncharacterized lipoprotein YmbA